MKVIALTPRLIENESCHEIREAVDVNWSRLLIENGFMPVLLSVNYTADMLRSLDLDGIVLTGGNDLFSVNKNKLSKIRDSFEKMLIGFCVSKKIPLLGICRGFQLTAEFFGAEILKTPDHVNKRHGLEKNVFGIEEVNSYHNWGVRELPSCLEILARAEDGVIEAFRHKAHGIMSLMWHPEREQPFRKSEMDIFRSFFKI